MKRITSLMLCLFAICMPLLFSCNCKNCADGSVGNAYEEKIGKSKNFRCLVETGNESFYLNEADAKYLYNLCWAEWSDKKPGSTNFTSSIKLSFMSDYSKDKNNLVHDNKLWYGQFSIHSNDMASYKSLPNEKIAGPYQLDKGVYNSIVEFISSFNVSYNGFLSKDSLASHSNSTTKLSLLNTAKLIGASIEKKSDSTFIITVSNTAYELNLTDKALRSGSKNLFAESFLGKNFSCEIKDNDAVLDSESMEKILLHMKRDCEITAKQKGDSFLISITLK